MSTSLTRALIALGVLLVLTAVNLSIYGKERTIAKGETIFLQLAPVDPRSLMQGDYMALRFVLAEDIEDARRSGKIADGARSAPIRIDERGVAHLDADGRAEHTIAFKIRNGDVWLGTNAYFFSEGSAQRFEGARFGEFRLDGRSGEAVLVTLRDEDLQKL
jgi:uncharacterized membrane-anchored protein